MALWFLVVDRSPADRHGAGGFLKRTGARTLRARLLVAEELDLLSKDLFDGPSGQGLGHVDGQRLDRVEIQIKPWSGFAKGTPGDDFSPAIDQIVQLGPILGLVPGKRHRPFILELGDRGKLGNRP
jgi:hypothetical protein